jgi:hypothetical protein
MLTVERDSRGTENKERIGKNINSTRFDIPVSDITIMTSLQSHQLGNRKKKVNILNHQ